MYQDSQGLSAFEMLYWMGVNRYLLILLANITIVNVCKCNNSLRD